MINFVEVTGRISVWVCLFLVCVCSGCTIEEGRANTRVDSGTSDGYVDEPEGGGWEF